MLRKPRPEARIYRQNTVSPLVHRPSISVRRAMDSKNFLCHTRVVVHTHTEDDMAISAHIEELSEKHRAIERKIEEELSHPSSDELRIAALKKEKLRLKDEIAKLKAETRH
jgi:hypothetical protein